MTEHPYREAPREVEPTSPLSVITALSLGAVWLLAAEALLLTGLALGLIALIDWLPEVWWVVPVVGVPLLWIRAQGGFRRTRRPRGQHEQEAQPAVEPEGATGALMQGAGAVLGVGMFVGHKVVVPWAMDRLGEHPWGMVPLAMVLVSSGVALGRWLRRLGARTE